MKNIKRVIFTRVMPVALALSLVCLTSCRWGFEDANTDLDKIKTEDMGKDNLWASYITSMQQTLFPEDDNAYQRMDDLHGNLYGGYHGQTNYWGGNNPTTYVFGPTEPWHNVGFQVVYGAIQDSKYPVPGIMNLWNQMRQRIEPTSVVYAVGEVLKVAGMHRATDMYGPIPYTKYGASLYTEYDSQETIYMAFFEELDHAIGVLTDYYTLYPAAKPIAKFDMIFGSDMLKWIKFANSLKLRLAMRIRYVNPTLSQQYAEEAMTHPHGLIEENTGNAIIQTSAIYNYTNPLTMLWEGYGECRMGATMDAYMNGYGDPRLGKYFSQATYAPAKNYPYKGARFGVSSGADKYAASSHPNFGTGDALYFMTAAEVYFLRAEAAMQSGWSAGGTASNFYETGIRKSMEQWGVDAAEATTYINSAASPVAYADPVNASGNAPVPSTITVKWSDGALDAEKLERIITQKWIAMYPNGQEAWSEVRRTGYPKVIGTLTNQNTAQVPNGVKRLPYPITEKLNNETIYNKAIADFFDGNSANDNPGTKLWWDAK